MNIPYYFTYVNVKIGVLLVCFLTGVDVDYVLSNSHKSFVVTHVV